MIRSSLNSRSTSFRDGTSQYRRSLPMLAPDYVSLDERSVDDLLAFAQQLAENIYFYDSSTNEPSGKGWLPLLIDEASAYYSKPDSEQSDHKEEWREEVTTFLADPTAYVESEHFATLSKPHLVLFITFLQLMQNQVSQMNALGEAHLDFYYKEALGLTLKDPTPDQVHVIVNLHRNNTGHYLEAGTRLDAGKDSEGTARIYETAEDVFITQAQIGSVKTVYVEKVVAGIEETRLNNIEDADKGFLEMVQVALGDPDPGDDFPTYPDGVASLHDLYNNLGVADNLTYVAESLYLTEGDFIALMDIHYQDMDSDPNTEEVSTDQWAWVYETLADAHTAKQEYTRRAALKTIRETGPDSDAGFASMMEYALGDPNAGDNLADYPSGAASLDDIHDWLKGNNETIASAALTYVNDELMMLADNFSQLISVKNNDAATDDEWESVYSLVEQAQRKKRGITVPIAKKEELTNIYAAPDAQLVTVSSGIAKNESHLHWEAFGHTPEAHTADAITEAQVGFACASPMLALAEGSRTITFVMQLAADTFDATEMENVLSTDADRNPFYIYLSTADSWITPSTTTITYGISIHGDASGAYTQSAFDANAMLFTKSTGDDFTKEDEGSYLILPDGTVYEIILLSAPDSVYVEERGAIDDHVATDILKYPSTFVYYNTLKFVLTLDETKDPVDTYTLSDDENEISSEWPQLKIIPKEKTADEQHNYYYLKTLIIEKTFLGTDVQGVTGFYLQSDSSVLEAGKPFGPFGNIPQAGASLYIAHPEISYKKLKNLTIDIDWMGVPDASLPDHYASYYQVDQGDSSLGPYHYYTGDDTSTDPNYLFTQDGSDDVNYNNETIHETTGWQIRNNTSFTVDCHLQADRRDLTIATNQALFDEADATVHHQIILTDVEESLEANHPQYDYIRSTDITTPAKASGWDRYLRLELNDPAFQHSNYSKTYAKQNLLPDGNAAKQLLINEPYTPKIKQMTLSYSSHEEIENTYDADTSATDQFYHLHPFGYSKIIPDSSDHYYLMPQYPYAGELLIGITDLNPPEKISILFQLAEGSADPDLEVPTVNWHYLSDNTWIQLDNSKIADNTDGLLNTGIILFSIPEDATSDNTLLSAGMHWIKATVSENTPAISDIIAIKAQAIQATFADQGNAPDHYDTPLPAETITNLAKTVTHIESIAQPFSSAKGRSAEDDTIFNTRVSERLRHKNRALTPWDYERLLLQQFPGIYKAKCLSSHFHTTGNQPGKVEVIVIPDIKGKLPFNPFEPKVSAGDIRTITTHLQTYSPPSAAIEVKNPSYMYLLTRFSVSFSDTSNVGYLITLLEEELKKFLSPWAYDEGADIELGGSIYANEIVNFIEERTYVDYVANMKLFQSDDGVTFTDVRTVNDGTNASYSEDRDIIWVSHTTHVIEAIGEEGYEDSKYGGIDYMSVELDLIVADEEKNQVDPNN